MSVEPGPTHLCRQGSRCKARVKDSEGKFHGAGVERPDSLCRPCEESAFADIRELGNDRVMLLAAVTEERSRLSGPKVSGSSELQVPINVSADALATAIVEESARWARRLPGEGDELTLICSQLGTLVDLPPQEVTLWVPHPDGGDGWKRSVKDGVDAVLDLAALHHRAVKLLDLGPERDQVLPEPCHVCGWLGVTSSIKTQLVTCHRCHNVWHQDEFARLNNPLVAA